MTSKIKQLQVRNIINAAQAQQLNTFADLAISYKKKHNITGAKDKQSFLDLIDDCIAPLSFLRPCQKILDVGAGAGLPGLALAIMLHQCEFYLLEPASKKYAFLNYASMKLRLNNVKIYQYRLQDFATINKNNPVKFDLICSKAFCSTTKFLALSHKHWQANTKILLYKNQNSLELEKINYPFQAYQYKKSIFLLIENTAKSKSSIS